MNQPDARHAAAPPPAATDARPDGAPGPAPDGPARRSNIGHALFVLGKRRTFIIDARSQLRATMMTSLVVLLLLVVVNVTLFSAREASADAVLRDAPGLIDLVTAQNRVETVMVAMASLMFLGGVFVISLLETHKTAGAAFNVARHMSAVESCRFGTRLRLRKDDNLRQLEPAFNDMCRGLQETAAADAELLEQLAGRVAKIASPPEAEQLAVELHRVAERSRQRAQ